MVRKLQITSPYQIGAYESWLSDMATRGLHLRKPGRIFATFEKGEPAKMEYRVDISKGTFSEERKRIYQESGWEYVARLQWAHIFHAPADAPKIEVHTDPVEQGFAVNSLRKSLIVPSIAIILLSILSALIGFLGIFISGTPVLDLIKSGGNAMFTAMSYLLVIIALIKPIADLRALNRALFKGKSVDHHESYTKYRIFNAVIYSLCAIILAFAILNLAMMFSLLGSMTSSSNRIQFDKNTETPFLQLRDLENLDDAYFRVDFYDDEEREAINSMPAGTLIYTGYSYSTYSLLAPDMRTMTETYDIIDGSGDASLDVEYYKLTFGWMAAGTMNDLMHKEAEWNFELTEVRLDFREIPVDGLDKVYVADKDYSTVFFVYKDNEVMMIEYSGDRTEEELLDAVVAKIEAN